VRGREKPILSVVNGPNLVSSDAPSFNPALVRLDTMPVKRTSAEPPMKRRTSTPTAPIIPATVDLQIPFGDPALTKRRLPTAASRTSSEPHKVCTAP